MALTGLPNGAHKVTVYAWGIAGNGGVSEISHFAIVKLEPFPTTLVAAAFAASATVVGLVLIIYVKKRKH